VLIATVAVAAIAALVGVGYLVFPRPSGKVSNSNQTGPQNQGTPAITPVDQNKLTGGTNPTPIADKPVTPVPTPVGTPIQNIVVDNPHVTPPGTPDPVAAVTPTPATPSTTPVQGPTAVSTPPTAPTPVDPKLVGKWETKHLHKNGEAEAWELQTDGKYVLSGVQDESGTLTAADGKILQYPSSTSQPQLLTYTFVGDKLVTKTPDGLETIWAKKHEDDSGGSRKQTHHREEGPHRSETPVWQKVIKNLPKLPWPH
jgi:hypothetical protein